MLPLVPLMLLQARPTLTLVFPPTPVPRALEILGAASGKKLAASTPFLDDVVLARLHDAPVDQTLAYLAESLLAKWETESDGTMRLVRDLHAVRAADAEREAADKTLLDNSLQYLAKRLAEQPAELDERAIQAYKAKAEAEDAARKAAEAAKDYARMFMASSAEEETPGWRAVARLMPLLGEKALLAMPYDDREVWAEKPTPMQHAFPPACEAALSQYRRELALLKPGVEVARVRIAVKKWEESSALNVDFEALAPNGTTVDRSGARMNDDSAKLKTPFTGPFGSPKPGEKPISIPEEALEARIALSRATNPKRESLLAKWQPRFLDPVKYEPTRWHTGTDFVAAAEEDGKNLIGTVGDVFGGFYWKPEKLTPSQVFGKAIVDVLPKPGGWLVVRDHMRRARASRSQARNLLSTSWRQGGISVDEAAAWVGQFTDRWPFVNWLGDYLGVLFSGGGPYSATATIIDDTSLRLWDELGSDVRHELRDGRTLSLGRLSPAAQAQLARIVYWFAGLDSSDEPTELLPNGIEGGSVSLTIAEKTVFIGWPSKEGRPAQVRPIDAASFGTFLAKGNTYWEEPADYYRSFDRFRLGTNRGYTLRFVLQPGSLPMTIHLTETLFDPSSKTVDQLPAAIRAEVEQARAKALAKPAPTPTKDSIPPG
ncbi:MAG TPA: hypothetical protein VHE55_02730 [Fimbriimonadaceae bacterium]|nr:hypothetical protein [Fimbriimonadaceae bacterium]